MIRPPANGLTVITQLLNVSIRICWIMGTISHWKFLATILESRPIETADCRRDPCQGRKRVLAPIRKDRQSRSCLHRIPTSSSLEEQCWSMAPRDLIKWKKLHARARESIENERHVPEICREYCKFPEYRYQVLHIITWHLHIPQSACGVSS